MLSYQAQSYLTSSLIPHRTGNSHPNIVPYSTFKTSDGYLIIAVGNDSQFHSFSKVNKNILSFLLLFIIYYLLLVIR